MNHSTDHTNIALIVGGSSGMGLATVRKLIAHITPLVHVHVKIGVG